MIATVADQSGGEGDCICNHIRAAPLTRLYPPDMPISVVKSVWSIETRTRSATSTQTGMVTGELLEVELEL